MIESVQKRNGTVVPFNRENIQVAVNNAVLSTTNEEDPELAKKVADRVSRKLSQDYKQQVPTVDEIHVLVENKLMDMKLYDIAREYISYRDRNKPDIFRKRVNIKPYEYPHLIEYGKAIQHSYWLFSEFNYTSDIQDIKVNLTEQERMVMIRAMLAISQVENKIKTFWSDIHHHIPKPEVSNVGAVIGENEYRHQEAYENLLKIMGLENEFEKLLEVPAIKNRLSYLQKAIEHKDADDPKEYFESIILFSTFVENISLFSQFFIIMSFNKHKNYLKGMSNVVEATSKEEECFIKGTEVMTPDGWRKIDEMEIGDPIYQFNSDNQTWEETSVLNNVNKYYEGNLIQFKNRCRECIVTPNHDMVFYNPLGELKKKKAKDFRGDTKKFVPQSAVLYNNSAEYSKLTDFERLLIAFQADGCATYWVNHNGEQLWRGVNGGYNASIKLLKERKKERLRNIFSRIDVNYVERECKNGKKKGFSDFAFHLEDAYKYKELNWIDPSNVTSEWCKEFVDELQYWDGSTIEEGLDTKSLYASTNKDCIDMVQLIGTLAGYRCHISKRIDNRKETFNDCYKVHFASNKERMMSHSIKKDYVPYNDTVHCVTVPSGVIMTRLDDNLFITGNCHANFGFDLINIIKEENPGWWNESIIERVKTECQNAFHAEMDIIEWMYEYGDIDVAPKSLVIEYIKYRFNKSMKSLGIDPLFEVDDNLIEQTDWFEDEIVTTKNVDFFNKRSVAYSKRAQSVTEDDLF